MPLPVWRVAPPRDDEGAGSDFQFPVNAYFYCDICVTEEARGPHPFKPCFPLQLENADDATRLFVHFAYLHAVDIAAREIRKRLPRGVKWRRLAWVQAGEDRIRFHDEEGSETRLYTEHHGGIIVSRIYRKRLREFYIKLDAQTYLVLSQARRLAHAILAAVKGRRDWYRPRRRRAIRGRR